MKALALLPVLLIAVCAVDYDASSTPSLKVVALDQSFDISLKSNPTTGFRWEVVLPLDKLELVSIDRYGKFEGPKSGTVGAGGKQTFSFTAKAVGEGAVKFVYTRPWSNEDSQEFEIPYIINPQ